MNRTAWLIFGTTLAIYWTTAGGSLTSTDAVVAYDLTRNLVEHRSIALSSKNVGLQARPGRDGRFYSSLGIGQSIFNIPFYLVGSSLENQMGGRFGKPDSLSKAAVAFGSTFAAAGCVAVAFLFAWRLCGAVRASAASAFALGFATVLWPYSKFGFNMPLATLLLSGGLYLVWVGVQLRHDRRLIAGGFVLGGALLTRHELILAAIPPLAWIIWASWPSFRLSGKRLALVGIPLAAAGGLWLTYNFVRFGHALDTGQLVYGQASLEMLQHPVRSFASPTLEGLYGLLASPSTSLFLYSPVAALGAFTMIQLGRRELSTAWLLGAEILILLLFFASLQSWSAGRSYGSRYLLPALPFLCIALAPWLDRAGRSGRLVFIVTFLVSLIVQLPGVLVDYSKVSVQFARTSTLSARARLFRWDASPLALNTRAALRAVPENVRYLTGVEQPPPIDVRAPEDRRDFAQQFVFSLDLWWLYLFYLGAIPAWVAVIFPVILLSAATVMVYQVARSMADNALR